MGDIEKIILEATEYGGNKNEEAKALSASQLSDDVLRLWLRYKYRVQPSEKIEMNTLGSLVHLGLEQIFKDIDNFEVEHSIEKKMDNGWSLTGTMDLYDTKKNIIYDWKMIKKYRVKKILEQGTNDPYVVQMNVYRYLTGSNPEMYIASFSSDAGVNFKDGSVESVFKLTEVPFIPDEEIEKLFYDQVELLQQYIEPYKTPPQCEDLWPRKIKGEVVKARCAYYCSFKDLCPRYHEKPDITLNSWGI